jgi:hypothetical protein
MERRILILAPFGRDADVIAEVLNNDGRECERCGDTHALTAELSSGAAAAKRRLPMTGRRHCSPGSKASPRGPIFPSSCWRATARGVLRAVSRYSSGSATLSYSSGR